MTSGHSLTPAELIDSRPHHPAEADMFQALLTIQQANRYVPVKALPQIAHAPGVTEADLAGVLSYFIRISEPLAWPSRDSCLHGGILHGQPLPGCLPCSRSVCPSEDRRDHDGPFTLEKVYCAGNCALSPTLVVDQDVHWRSTSLPSVVRLLYSASSRENAFRNTTEQRWIARWILS